METSNGMLIECPKCHEMAMFHLGTVGKDGKWSTSHYACYECGHAIYVTSGNSRDGKRYYRELGKMAREAFGPGRGEDA